QPLFRYIPYPVRLENDATAGGRTEGWNFQDNQMRAYLSVGEGIGGCILFGSRPYQGQNGRAAEFGHMRIVPHGRLCQCGKHGCLEAYCSTTQLSAACNGSLESFFIHLRDGTPRYTRIWEEYLDSLALGVHNIRMTLDCDIVLGGKLSQHLASYLGDLTSRLREMDSFESPRSYLSLSRMGSFTNAMGCALGFVQEFIRNI
ncbi:MAG: ROK family protein, partial [Butyricicoccus sp.]